MSKKPVITKVVVQNECLLSVEAEGCPFRCGKVRDIFDLGDTVLMVATDRISAYDVIIPTPIPGKGRVLTGLSQMWFQRTPGIVPNCMITTDINKIGEVIELGSAGREMLDGRSMLMKKCRTLPIECVVRGYLVGSGWKEYQKTQTVCGIPLPSGLVQASQLSPPIFTPSTKEEMGAHDKNITYAQACELAGEDMTGWVCEYSLALYISASEFAAERGVIIADTKFEFGIDGDGRLVLVDEVLTPDSSRFWPVDQYRAGIDPPSFDKQFVRNYLEQLCAAGKWDKTANNVPVLPAEVVEQTVAKYREALQRLTA